MALFGSARDANLIRSVNRELINRYIDTEVGFYKLNLEGTNTNIYDESDDKVYYGLMKMNSIILKDTKAVQSDDFGIDYARNATFAFLRDDLTAKNIIMETGDVIEYDGEFFEIDSTSSSEYFAGKNPGRDLGFTLGDRDEFGYSVSVVCETHVTRRNRLNIQEVRSGINKKRNDIPRNL
jgi:hypothetical protein